MRANTLVPLKGPQSILLRTGNAASESRPHTPQPTRLAAAAPPMAVGMPGLVYLGLRLLPGSLGWRAADTPLSPHHPAPRSPAGPASAPSPPASERSLPRGLFHTLSTLFQEVFLFFWYQYLHLPWPGCFL